MAQSNTDNLVSMRLPAIVAVRGRPSPEKSKLARQIADFLKYPLIDEEHILKVKSHYRSVSVPHETCLEIILRMASSQLTRSQTGIVISATAFSYPRVFQRFQDLKNSKGARMIVVLYEPEDHQSDLTGIPTVWIDPAKPVFLQGKLGHEILGLFTTERKPETHNSHFHYLTRRDNQKLAGGEWSSCRSCSKSISDSHIYHCDGCNDCAFHTYCAEPYRLDSERPTDTHFPPCFTGKSLSSSATVEFPTGNPCGVCTDKGDFSRECFECLYEAFVRSKSFPAIKTMKWHKHSLRYVIMPRSYGYIYHCLICDIGGEMAGYKCVECCLDFHPTCVVNSIRKMVKSNHHSKHALRLRKGGGDDDQHGEVGEDVRCNVCQRSIEDPLVWRYVCSSSCKFTAHTTCVLDL